MHARSSEGILQLRFSARFSVRDVERLSETIRSLAPQSQLALDFTDVCEFQGPAYDVLAEALVAIRAPEIRLRGLTLHRAEVLRRAMAKVRGSHGSMQPCSPALIPLHC